MLVRSRAHTILGLVVVISFCFAKLAFAGGWRIAGVRQSEGMPLQVALPNGGVAMCGSGADGAEKATDKCDIWDAQTGALTALPNLTQARSGGAFGRFADGTLIIAGGSSEQGKPLSSAEILRPGEAHWQPFASLPASAAGRVFSVAMKGGSFGLLLAPSSPQECEFEFYVAQTADGKWQPVKAPAPELCATHIGADELGAVAVLTTPHEAGADTPADLWWWLPQSKQWVKQTMPEIAAPRRRLELVPGNGHLFLKWREGVHSFMVPLSSAEPLLAPGPKAEVPDASYSSMAQRSDGTWHISRYTGQSTWRHGEPTTTKVKGALQAYGRLLGVSTGDVFCPNSSIEMRVAVIWSQEAESKLDPCQGLTAYTRDILLPALNGKDNYANGDGYYRALTEAVTSQCRARIQVGKAPALWKVLHAGLARPLPPSRSAAFVVLATALQLRGASARAMASFREKAGLRQMALRARVQLLISLAQWPAANPDFAMIVREGVISEKFEAFVDDAFIVAATESVEVAARLGPLLVDAYDEGARGFDELQARVCPLIEPKAASKKVKRICGETNVQYTWSRNADRAKAIAFMAMGAGYGVGMLTAVELSDSPDTRRELATLSGGSTGLILGGLFGMFGSAISFVAGGGSEEGVVAAMVVGAIAGGILGGVIANNAVSSNDADNAATVTSVGLILPVSTLLLVGYKLWPDD